MIGLCALWLSGFGFGAALALWHWRRHVLAIRCDYQELHDELAAAYREIRLQQWRARRNTLPPAWFPSESER